MNEENRWSEPFEAHRARLRAVAYRMLGSQAEVEDAVQEAWVRLDRSSTDEVENLGGWLTTVVARICLDMLRSRKSRAEVPLETGAPGTLLGEDRALDPEQELLLADSVGPAMLIVLDTMAPSERVAFVLHDMFAVPFEEIARIVGRTPAAVRQLASRGRRRARGGPAAPDPDLARRREVVDAFLAAAREGRFEALLALLDPDVVFRPDAAGELMGVAALRGPEAVANRFKGGAQAARAALVNGAPGLVWVQGGQVRVVFDITIENGRIATIDLIGDPARIEQIDLEFLDD